MNDPERLEFDRRVREIVDRFRNSPELQNEVLNQLIAEGIIDERGQVICLRNGSKSSVADVSD